MLTPSQRWAALSSVSSSSPIMAVDVVQSTGIKIRLDGLISGHFGTANHYLSTSYVSGGNLETCSCVTYQIPLSGQSWTLDSVNHLYFFIIIPYTSNTIWRLAYMIPYKGEQSWCGLVCVYGCWTLSFDALQVDWSLREEKMGIIGGRGRVCTSLASISLYRCHGADFPANVRISAGLFSSTLTFLLLLMQLISYVRHARPIDVFIALSSLYLPYITPSSCAI